MSEFQITLHFPSSLLFCNNTDISSQARCNGGQWSWVLNASKPHSPTLQIDALLIVPEARVLAHLAACLTPTLEFTKRSLVRD